MLALKAELIVKKKKKKRKQKVEPPRGRRTISVISLYRVGFWL